MTKVKIRIGFEIGVGLALDTVATTRVGEADPVHIIQATPGRPGGETTEIETVVVATIGGSLDPTADHAHPEGIGTEDIPETQMKRSSWVMMRLLMSSSGLLPWKSKVEVVSTRRL